MIEVPQELERFLPLLMWLAIAGFVASAIVNVRALMGLPSPFGSATWLLHIGIFVVWVPSILIAQRLSQGGKRSNFWRTTFRGCPGWVKAGAFVVGAYAFVNFALFAVQTQLYPKHAVPEDVVHRGFSGHWMAFYYFGAAMLYSGTRPGNASST